MVEGINAGIKQFNGSRKPPLSARKNPFQTKSIWLMPEGWLNRIKQFNAPRIMDWFFLKIKQNND
jgi:hypothetical protein